MSHFRFLYEAGRRRLQRVLQSRQEFAGAETRCDRIEHLDENAAWIAQQRPARPE
jgi:hypothetical protein